MKHLRPTGGKGGTVNATMKGNKTGTSMPESLSTKLNRLTEKAKSHPEFKFKTLAHLLNEEMLIRSYNALKKQAAAGVDGMTTEEYGKNLQSNIANLHRLLSQNQYRAQPLRRVYIKKEDGKQRPLSIPAMEDKIVQRAVAEILGRIYEVDFKDCSYGYRPKRGPHEAVNSIRDQITLGKVSYVLDADIKDYFGSIVRKQLMKILENRIADKAILRLVGKWLNVGVIEDGRLIQSDDGTYQGAIISPILANIYLHEALDTWVCETVAPRMKGEIRLWRFADDFVVSFQHLEDAKRFSAVLPKRFASFGLTLHPDKTRMIEFGRFAQERRKGKRPETFQFLGFTFYCSSTYNKKFMVKLKTSPKRLRRGLKAVESWCKKNRHLPVPVQHEKLKAVLIGHYQYYGRSSNLRSLGKFYYQVRRIWHKWLSRRSSNGYINWDDFEKLLNKYPLPRDRITERIKGRQISFAM